MTEGGFIKRKFYFPLFSKLENSSNREKLRMRKIFVQILVLLLVLFASNVHANEMNGSIGAVAGEVLEHGGEEGRKLILGHLARGHGELAVLHLP